MAWNVSGQLIEFCSCNIMCPCWLGPAPQPDQGWCSGALVYDIAQGQIDGIEVGGTTVVFAADWPGNFFGGNGTARLYVDDRASAAQRRELEAVFSGKKGGPMEAVSGLMTKWLPTQAVPIKTQWSDSSTFSVGKVAQLQSQRLKDQTGKPTTVQGAVAMAAFQFESMGLANSDGSHWSDPEMRRWNSGGSGTRGTFNWRV